MAGRPPGHVTQELASGARAASSWGRGVVLSPGMCLVTVPSSSPPRGRRRRGSEQAVLGGDSAPRQPALPRVSPELRSQLSPGRGQRAGRLSHGHHGRDQKTG